jgi:hypothetical protein
VPELTPAPNAGNANNVRIVYAGNGGALNNNNANNANGVRPIERTVRHEYERKAEHLSQGVIFLSPRGAKRPRTGVPETAVSILTSAFAYGT